MLTRRLGMAIGACLGVTLLMMIGCDKGALGLKPGTIFGRVYDADTRQPIEGVEVQLLSKTLISPAGSQVQLGTTRVCRSDIEGRFAFEDVPIDTYKINPLHPAYAEYDSGDVPLAAPQPLDFGIIYLTRLASATNVGATIVVRGVILDGTSRDELRPTDVLQLYFDGVPYQRDPANPAVVTTYADFRNGLTLTAKSGDFDMTLVVDGYQPLTTTAAINGSRDGFYTFELQRIAYSVLVTFLNKPNYITDDVIEFASGTGDLTWGARNKCMLTVLASSTTPGSPDKVLNTTEISMTPYIPQAELASISLPAVLKIHLSGFTTLTYNIPSFANLQGLIEMNIDMSSPAFASHRILRPVRLDIYAKRETNASDQIQLAWIDLCQVRALDRQWGPDTLQNVELQLNDVPCGYVIPFDTRCLSEGWDFINSRVIRAWFGTTNYYYIEPVRVNTPAEARNATFTAHLMISRTDNIYPRKP